MSAPAVLLAVPLLCGAAAAVQFAEAVDPRFAVAAAGAALLALLAAAGALAVDSRPEEPAAALALAAALAGLSLGATAARRAVDTPLIRWFDSRPDGGLAIVEGVLREDASPTPIGASLVVDVTSIDGRDIARAGRIRRGTAGGVRVSVAGTLHAASIDRWRAGRTVRLPAYLRRPSTYLNPGTPDDRRALARRRIVLVGSVKSAALIDVVRAGGPAGEIAASVRAWTRRRIGALRPPLDSRSAGITTAILIGDRSGLSVEDEKRLQRAGTYHVIAISGGNVGILTLAVLLACRLLWLPPALAAIATGVAIVGYGLIAAGGASVWRAVAVAAIVMAGRAIDQRSAALNVVAGVAVAAVATAPVAVMDAGFLLSFGATIGILLGVPRLTAAGPTGQASWLVGRLRLAAISLAAATVCAEVALAPVSASLFAQVPLAGLLLNFAAIPLMTLVQIGGIAAAALGSTWQGGARVGGAVAHAAAIGLLESSRLVDAVPWLSLDVRPPVWWLIGIHYCSALCLCLTRVRRFAAGALALATAAMLFGPAATTRDAVPPPRHPLRVVVFDVGQGDATVAMLPGGRALLVDAGGTAPFVSAEDDQLATGFDVGERVVARGLRALGLRRLDALVVTHGDPDHIRGARGVLDRIPAASIWEGVPVPPHQGLRLLSALARERSMTWRTLQAGDAERFDAVEVRVLHPPLPDWERQRVRNDDSVVLELRVGAVSIVLPGDIGAEGERAIAGRVEEGRLVVVKAPHHGSATSSTAEWLAALRPAAVIFSCGRDNRFGHPHPAVVDRYRARGTRIFSTADHGAVFVETDGTTVEVRGWSGNAYWRGHVAN